jgi:hypothetical protein
MMLSGALWTCDRPWSPLTWRGLRLRCMDQQSSLSCKSNSREKGLNRLTVGAPRTPLTLHWR